MRNRKVVRKMFLEALENRALLAGNVTVLVDDGSLIVRGDAAANGVEIHQTNAGRYVVSGFGLGGTDTRINGTNTAQVFTGVTADIVVDLQGGDDVLVMNNDAAARQALANNLSDGGAGTLKDSPEASDPSVSPSRVGVPRNLLIQTGDGNDGVGLSVIAGQSAGGFGRVDTGTGDDEIIVRNSTFARDLTLDSGDGVDSVELTNVRVADGLFASLGIGNDSLVATGIRAGGIGINGAAGADDIQLMNVRSAEDTAVFTGGGNDTVRIGGLIAGDLTVNTGAGSDVVRLANSQTTGAAQISTGDGDDSVQLNNVTVHEDLVVLLGSGNDRLTVHGTDAASAYFSGGDGQDVLDTRTFGNANNANHFGSFSRTGFESILRDTGDHNGDGDGSDGGSDGGTDGGIDD